MKILVTRVDETVSDITRGFINADSLSATAVITSTVAVCVLAAGAEQPDRTSTDCCISPIHKETYTAPWYVEGKAFTKSKFIRTVIRMSCKYHLLSCIFITSSACKVFLRSFFSARVWSSRRVRMFDLVPLVFVGTLRWRALWLLKKKG